LQWLSGSFSISRLKVSTLKKLNKTTKLFVKTAVYRNKNAPEYWDCCHCSEMEVIVLHSSLSQCLAGGTGCLPDTLCTPDTRKERARAARREGAASLLAPGASVKR